MGIYLKSNLNEHGFLGSADYSPNVISPAGLAANWGAHESVYQGHEGGPTDRNTTERRNVGNNRPHKALYQHGLILSLV